MANAAIIAALVAFRGEVDTLITHVEAGVTSLNEDQVAEAEKLFGELETKASSLKDEGLSLLGKMKAEFNVVETKVESGVEAIKDKIVAAVESL